VLAAEPGAFARGLAQHLDAAERSDGSIGRAWVGADTEVAAALAATLAGHHEVTEPGIARGVVAALPARSSLVVSSSMPVRDVEWYSAPRPGISVLANRGANGIDGVVSTAVGVALGSNRPTAVLIGDVAFLHDTNALLGIAGRAIDLAIVVVDNDGGGIFSFLPQAGALAAERFEQLFGTPHGVDPGAIAAAHGLDVTRLDRADDVEPAVAGALASGGVHVLVARTDRAANVAVHDELHAACAAALGATATDRP